MSRPKTLAVESLERREVPALFGNPWSNADRLTLSFAPNGVPYSTQTGTGTLTSNLFAELNGSMATSVWQEEILRAFYAWTAQANINVGLVADTGRAFGPDPGRVTGAAPADVRVGAFDQSPEVLATSIPNHPMAGSRAGTLMLNGVKAFSKGGANGTYDLYTVALNEAANIFGMADDDQESGCGRDGNYNGANTAGLTASDVATVRSLYGLRANDQYDAVIDNDSVASATTLSAVTDPASPTLWRVVANGNITTTTDADVYKFKTTAGTSTFTVRLGTAGKSLLAGKIEVLDDKGAVVATKTNTSPLQGDTVFTLTGAKTNATYYVRVTAGRTDAFAVGTYQLRVGFNYDPVTETKPDPVQRLGADGGTNNTLSTYTSLTTTAGYDLYTRYSAAAVIESTADADYYQVLTSAGPSMTVALQGVAGMSAAVTVYTITGQVVPSTVLVNEGGFYSVQVPNAHAHGILRLRVALQNPTAAPTTGGYLLDVDFKQPVADTSAVYAGTVTQSSRTAVGIVVDENRAYTFSLAATTTNAAVVNWFDVYIYDQSGVIVAKMGGDGGGGTTTMTAYLKKGKYTVQVVPKYLTTSSATTTVRLSAALLSDPIDVYDPNSPPPPPASPPITVVTNPGTGYYDPWSPPVG